jgi:hypothetical protein
VVFETDERPEFPINPLNAELNPMCHLLALLGGATIVVVSKIRVKKVKIEAGVKRRKNKIHAIYV